jgi:DNA-binding response OmpR family regulator
LRFDPLVSSSVLDLDSVQGTSLVAHLSRLLLVESETILSDLTAFRLELLGYQLRCLSTGAAAFQSLQQELPDALLVDTRLSDGDGIEWVARFRGQIPVEKLPILMFSLDPSMDMVERAFVAGAQDYLITPFDPTVLEYKIEKLLQSRLESVAR